MTSIPNEIEQSINQEAEQIINGPRRDSYGPADESFKKIATMWSVILNAKVSPRQVALMMIAFKVVRDSNKANRDNLVDIAGYAGLGENLE